MAGPLGADADEWASSTLEIPVLRPLRKPERKGGWYMDDLGFPEAVSSPPLLL